LHEQMSKAKKVERALAEQLDRNPTRAEVAAAVGITVARLEALTRTHRLPTSMDAPLRGMGGNGEAGNVEDYIADESAVRSSPLHRVVAVVHQTSDTPAWPRICVAN
jgi:DNA-directed RNA polymerase sigma subunit (sigma70/sigma32)